MGNRKIYKIIFEQKWGRMKTEGIGDAETKVMRGKTEVIGGN